MRIDLDLAQLEALPLTNRVTIPEDYLDEMGHMNIMYYIHIFDRAAWEMFGWFGLSIDDLKAVNGGMFALRQFIQYLAEVHVGETVTVRTRVLGKSAKRLHFMHFMINETTGKLASTFEVLGSYVDMTTRRTTPFNDEMAALIQKRIDEHAAIDWNAPISGVIRP